MTRNLPIETARLFYAEEVRFVAGIRSRALVEAFATVPREHYLGPGPWQIFLYGEYFTTEDADPRYLYHDALVAIDPARGLNNGQPSALARWLDDLELREGDRMFHVGCGLGYYTAIIAHVVGARGRVVAVELDPGLAERARTNLAHINSVEVITGDGVTYDPGDVDAIFVNAGVTHPQTLWLDRLRPDGRLMIPITTISPLGTHAIEAQGSSGQMLLVRRVTEGYQASFVSLVGIYASPSGRDPELNRALAQAFRETTLGKRRPVQSLRRDLHAIDESCWLHSKNCCLSTLSVGSPLPDARMKM